MYMQGARRQGIKEHIKVKKKFDALGVGAVSPANALNAGKDSISVGHETKGE
jgi:hypothetical protein